jgi:hypothetical protein
MSLYTANQIRIKCRVCNTVKLPTVNLCKSVYLDQHPQSLYVSRYLKLNRGQISRQLVNQELERDPGAAKMHGCEGDEREPPMQPSFSSRRGVICMSSSHRTQDSASCTHFSPFPLCTRICPCLSVFKSCNSEVVQYFRIRQLMKCGPLMINHTDVSETVFVSLEIWIPCSIQ